MATSDTVTNADVLRPFRRILRRGRVASALLVLGTASAACSVHTTSAPGASAPRTGDGSGGPATVTTTSAAPRPTAAPPQLPRGGRTVFPAYRLVGFAGHPESQALGRLGIGDLDARAREIVSVGARYADGRRVMPVLELIATVVRSDPGADGRYRTRTSDRVIAEHLAAARRVKGILLLDIQPGRADFLDEVRHYEKWLRQPDVGVALDPEWAMGPGEVPMRTFGHTTGAKIDEVSTYLAGLVRNGNLPEKVLVFHQLAPSIVRSEKQIRTRPGVVVVKSVDGIGSPAMKQDTYRELVAGMPRMVHAGFKLFYDEDRRSGPLMTPRQVLALRPQPEYVLYE